MNGGPRRYRIQYPVGKGAFGTVYRATMIGEGGFHKDVAIKLMNADLEAAEEVEQRQRDEARLLGLIRHRAILQVDGLVRLNGSWAVVMEYIDGVNLRELLRFGPVPPSCALNIIAEVAGALAVALNAKTPDGTPLNIIHRDIKPPNIQLTTAGEVKLLDFGVARASFDARESETVGVILGTMRYMAPERLDGFDSFSGDIYALGVVLVELLTRKPMKKTSSNTRRHEDTVAGAVQAVQDAIGTNHKELIKLIKDCLRYNPEDRPDATTLERMCWDIAQKYPLPRLQEWSKLRVREAQEHIRQTSDPDPLSGETLREQTENFGFDSPSGLSSLTSTTKARTAAGLIGASALVGLFAITAGVVVAGLVYTQLPHTNPQRIAPPSTPQLGAVDQRAVLHPTVYRQRADGTVLVEPTPREPNDPPHPIPNTAPVPKPIETTPPPKAKKAPLPKPVIIQENSGFGQSGSGQVSVRGVDSGVQLVGAMGTFTVPGRIPAGIYDVNFNGVQALKGVRVRRGGRLSITCDSGFGMCKLE